VDFSIYSGHLFCLTPLIHINNFLLVKKIIEKIAGENLVMTYGSQETGLHNKV
jgi:hypothetical protein